jgi:hypothetical protein
MSHVRGVRRVLALVLAVGAVTGVGLVAALGSAGASPTIEAGPTPGSAGLPDGRLYEEVSPANKNGNYVASGGISILVAGQGYAAAAPGGDAVVFLSSGAMGESVSSMVQPYVAHRTPGLGWETASTVPPQQGLTRLSGGPTGLLESSDMSRFAFTSQSLVNYSPEEPLGAGGSAGLYVSEDPFAPPVWLGKPLVADAIPQPGQIKICECYRLVGGTPTLSTVYFTYSGTLIAQDASRAPNVGDGQDDSETDAWGFYEWSGGTLAEAGVLPDGTVSPFGAVPAALAAEFGVRTSSQTGQPANFDNEVAAGGSRAFFVSPDPQASTVTDPGFCEKGGPCTSAPPELYVRERAADGSKSTVLVSQSQLPGHVGELAPDGPVSVADALSAHAVQAQRSYVYASVDGSQAFFASRDRLTVAAPEDGEVKEYDFDLDSGVLTYLPNVVGSIVAVSGNGSDFLFEERASEPFSEPGRLELWRGGPNGGTVTEVAQLPWPPEPGGRYDGDLDVEGRASADGSVFVFDTNAPVPGGFNNATGYSDVYRYDASAETLTCVSCLPAGVEQSGDAYISYDDGPGGNDRPLSNEDSRAMSADGSRVFFDTPDPLVAQDTNGKRDVYEWENGHVDLISPGTSSEDAYYLDNSESGGDVFFSTAAGIVAGDTDAAYDVYDARVPRPGDDPPPAAVPCQGDVCQGPPSVPSLLGAPASAAFNGLGNLTPSSVVQAPKAKPKSKSKKKRARGKKKARRRRARAKGGRVSKRDGRGK